METYIRVPLYGEPGDPVRIQARFENGVVLDTEITEEEAWSLANQLRVEGQIRQAARDQRLRLACLGTPGMNQTDSDA